MVTWLSYLRNNVHNPGQNVYIEFESEINQDMQSATRMMMAASRGDAVCVQQLINEGVSVSSRAGFNRHTPMKHAAVNGHVHIMRILVRHGADVNSCGYDGTSALHFAAITFQREALLFLIRNGASVAKPSHDGTTPLMSVLSMFLPCNVMDERKIKVIEILLSAGAVVYEHRAYYRSALVEIVRAPGFSIPPAFQLRAFDLLVKFGANVNERDAHGQTALHYAAACGNLEMAIRLLKAGINIETADDVGRTAKDVPCEKDGYVAVRFLLEEVSRRIRDVSRMQVFSMGLHKRAVESPVHMLTMEHINAIFKVRRPQTQYEHDIEEIVDLQIELQMVLREVR